MNAPYKIKFIISVVGITVLIVIAVLVFVITVAITCWRLKRKHRNNSTTSQTATELQDGDSEVYYSEIGCPAPPIAGCPVPPTFSDWQVDASKYEALLDKGAKDIPNFRMKKNSAYTSTKTPSTTDGDDINVSMNYAYGVSPGRKIPNYKYSMEVNVAYGIPSRT